MKEKHRHRKHALFQITKVLFVTYCCVTCSVYVSDRRCVMLGRHVVYFVDRNVARIHRDERANINVPQAVCIWVSDVISVVRCITMTAAV